MQINTSTLKLLPKFLTLLPLGITALYLWRYAVDLPITDQWEVVNLLQAWVKGDVQAIIGALVAQHNEYRPVVARLFFLLLFPFTAWDTRAEMWVSVLVCIGIFALALALMRRAGVINGTFPSLVISLVCFSLGQFENILWGWQLAVYLQVFLGLSALYALSNESWRGTAFAGLAGLAATFSYQVGIATWLALWSYLLLRRRPVVHVLIILFFTAASLLLQYGNFSRGGQISNLLSGRLDLTRLVPFFVMNVGAPLGVLNEPLSGVMGVALLTVLVIGLALLWRAQGKFPLTRESAIVLSLIAMSLGASALITLGRHHLGSDWAVLSRYTTVTAAGVLGVYALTRQIYVSRPSPFTARMLAFITSAILIGLGFSTLQGISSGQYSWATRMMLRFTVQSGDFEFVDHRVIFHDLGVLQRRLKFLQEHRLGVHREPPLIFVPKQVNAKSAGSILPAYTLIQVFRCPVNTLYDFKLPFATFGRQNTANLQVVLRQGEQELLRQTIPMSEIKPDTWIDFRLPSPVYGCFGQELTLELSSEDATPENTVTVWTFPATYEVIRSHTSPGIQEGYAVGLKLNYVYYRLPF